MQKETKNQTQAEPSVLADATQRDLFDDELSPDDQSKLASGCPECGKSPTCSVSRAVCDHCGASIPTIHIFKREKRWAIEVRCGKSRHEVFASGRRDETLRDYIKWK